MRILIAGGSGFLGSHLTIAFAAAGHDVSILTRHPQPARATRTAGPHLLHWSPNGSLGPWADAAGPVDIVINLAGTSIGNGRWSPSRKATLVASRLNATRSLVELILHASHTPTVFISSSAIGYYGDRADNDLVETAPPGHDFLAQLCTDWEHCALAAASPTTRIVLLRSGLILDAQDGALPKMLRPFRLGFGGPFDSGRQFMSWIHRDDWVRLVIWTIDARTVAGPLNATAPDAVTNAQFTRALGRALHRPAFMRAPAFALRLALGEMAGPLLLFSQRVRPARALEAGFRFTYPTLDTALSNLLAE